MSIRLEVNGIEQFADPVGPESLLFTLRERLGLPGSKNACEQGECGSCSVILDGRLVCSCLVMTADADGSSVTTIEGLGDGSKALDRVQRAMLEAGGVQCGFCTPGIVVAATALFERDPAPSLDDIKEALAGNLCRCTGYGSILRGLTLLAEEGRP
jgi:carbon-monoxide dehydrogenase small subunit